MGEIVNLHKRRKRTARQREHERAAASRIVHGRTKEQRAQEDLRAEKRQRDLDAHKIDPAETT